MTTSAADLTFGLEIECYIPEANINFRIGSYHNGIQVPTLPQGWKAERDSSIRPPVGKVAVEFVSPILMGADGVRQVEFVLQWLRDMGAGCNESCGIHVHVGSDKKTAQKLVGLVAQYEKALFAVSGQKGKTRAANNIFCRSMVANEAIRSAYAGRTQVMTVAGQSRYNILNLTNLLAGVRPAVEFRAFASTFKTEVVLGYIRICLGMVQVAATLKREVKFTSVLHKPTDTGVDHVRYLLLRLRWGFASSKSAQRTKDGVDFGWVASSAQTDPKAARKAMLATAKEFDAEMAI